MKTIIFLAVLFLLAVLLFPWGISKFLLYGLALLISSVYVGVGVLAFLILGDKESSKKIAYACMVLLVLVYFVLGCPWVLVTLLAYLLVGFIASFFAS